MGFDKPDLGFVVHYQRPGSAIAYYQQVGRAGRAVERAHGILLSGREDDEIADYFIRTAFPPTGMRELLAALEAVESMTIGRFQRAVNLTRGQIDQALKQLELDGARDEDRRALVADGAAWEPDEERIERVTATRRDELEQMRAYVTTECRMAFLTGLLDDPAAAGAAAAPTTWGRGWPTPSTPSAPARRSTSCAGASARSSRASAGSRARPVSGPTRAAARARP